MKSYMRTLIPVRCIAVILVIWGGSYIGYKCQGVNKGFYEKR